MAQQIALPRLPDDWYFDNVSLARHDHSGRIFTSNIHTGWYVSAGFGGTVRRNTLHEALTADFKTVRNEVLRKDLDDARSRLRRVEKQAREAGVI